MNKPTILYVDDEIINLELFQANLESNYNVLLAEDGEQGLKILETQSDIRIVISDMRMPNMTGIEFISKAKALYPSISYYIFTGYDITTEIRDAINNGLIVKYFRKPFNINEIDLEIKKKLQS